MKRPSGENAGLVAPSGAASFVTCRGWEPSRSLVKMLHVVASHRWKAIRRPVGENAGSLSLSGSGVSVTLSGFEPSALAT